MREILIKKILVKKKKFFSTYIIKCIKKHSKKVRERYQYLSEEEKDKWRKKFGDRYRNLLSEKKNKSYVSI